MSYRVKSLVMMFAACLALHYGIADARFLGQKVCASIPFPDGGDCWEFDGARCVIGVRGAFLDLTNQVTVVTSRPSATATIVGTGVDTAPSNQCVPTGQGREGYVSIQLTNIEGTGRMTIKLLRPNAVGGRDFDDIEVDVKRGTFLKKDTFNAHVNEPRTMELTGGDLTLLKVLAPDANNEILSKTGSTARVRLTFTQPGTFGLDTKLGFLVARPVLNETNGWPTVTVTGAPAPPPAGNPPPPPPPPPPSSTRPALPNLLPSVVFPSRPLIRKINNLQSIMIPAAFCAGLANNEEREVAVPDFEWAVTNAGAAVNSPFSSTVGGATPLATQQLPGIPQNDIRTFRNWPGRPARIRVVKVTGPPLLGEYQNSVGCYLPNATASRVPLDPRPINIMVDSATQITESNEPDNLLPVN
jgi:hypothetical protein